MKRTIRENVLSPYSLHDMCVIAFETAEDALIMRLQSGLVKAASPCMQLDGYIEFHGVRWDYCYAYLLDIAANSGAFTGEKMSLKDFIAAATPCGLTIMDESYGYNATRYSGYMTCNGRLCECFLEIYHEENMVFVTDE